jgi:hypothetical protein
MVACFLFRLKNPETKTPHACLSRPHGGYSLRLLCKLKGSLNAVRSGSNLYLAARQPLPRHALGLWLRSLAIALYMPEFCPRNLGARSGLVRFVVEAPDNFGPRQCPGITVPCDGKKAKGTPVEHQCHATLCLMKFILFRSS